MEREVPLHFLKVLQFGELTKPQKLFLYILFDNLFQQCDKETLKRVFRVGLGASKKQGQFEAEEQDDQEQAKRMVEFKKGVSEYFLTHFYIKKKKDLKALTDKESREAMNRKFKAVFDVINSDAAGLTF
mmetsp:Transcript_38937/g.37268  ORF Transcript_38937/g.37268 Transcript_38937/m.37268 type:complete len:129 (-) Transcript_38937:9-395(-)